jgi:transposase
MNLATSTAGMDLGDKYCQICLLDEEGDVMEASRVSTTSKGIRSYFGLRASMRVVIEVGTHSPWIGRLLEECGHEVIVANPRRVRLIAENNHKNDDTDAELLARLGRSDPKLLAPITHRTEETQQALIPIRARALLVGMRTKLVNSVRGFVKSVGARMPSCSTGKFGSLTNELPDAIRASLLPIMESIRLLTTQIRDYDKEIERLAEDVPEAQLMCEIAGVGPLTALTFIGTIEDPTRFKRSRSVGPFIGLTPRQKQSGASDPQMRISKAGDWYLRTLLVQAAHYILGPFGPDTALRTWGLALAARGGKSGKKRAAVAVARKLAVTMLALWKSGGSYQVFPSAKQVA